MNIEEVFDFDVVASALGVSRGTLPSHAPKAPVRPPRVSVEPLSDAEWEIVRAAMPALPVPRVEGFRDREFFDAALWHRVAKDRGLSWAAMPDHFPPRMTVQHRWHRWAMAGTWGDISQKLQGDERLTTEHRRLFQRIAADAAKKRKRVLAARVRANESL